MGSREGIGNGGRGEAGLRTAGDGCHVYIVFTDCAVSDLAGASSEGEVGLMATSTTHNIYIPNDLLGPLLATPAQEALLLARSL